MCSKKLVSKVLIVCSLAVFMSHTIYGAILSHSYESGKVNNLNVNYITLDTNDKGLMPQVVIAENDITSTASLKSMATEVNAIAAINGTYFEAYSGSPIPWGTIIQNGKVLHVGSVGSTVGITDDNKLIIDLLKISFTAYVDGRELSKPWRINNPSASSSSMIIYTEEYGKEVVVKPGTLSPIIKNGVVTDIISGNFTVPNDAFAISYGPSVAHVVEDYYEIGIEVYYEYEYKTTFTDASDWENVTQAIGAGPSLIINGAVTASPQAEGFTEAKITTNKAARTFIGATADGDIKMGFVNSATVAEMAIMAAELGLVDAMCLDGGGSTSLYFKEKGSITAGRAVNNGLAFITSGDHSDTNSSAVNISISGTNVIFSETTGIPFTDGNNRTQVPLRVTMERAGATVSWDDATQIATIQKNDVTVEVKIGASEIIVNEKIIENDTEAMVVNGKTYLPIRAVLVAFGYEVGWDNASQTVTAT